MQKINFKLKDDGDVNEFSTRIPLTNKKPDEAIIISDGDLMQNLPRRVLVVDDNMAAAQTLAWLMEMNGHDCKMALNGETALKIGHEFQPEFVFLDIGMPNMDGYDLCQRMRALPELERTIFIAQTGWSEKQYVERSYQAGFHHHLVKPLDYNKVEQLLK